jgi:hypothetical protein
MPLGFLRFDLHHQMGSQTKFRVVSDENVRTRWIGTS